MSGETDARSALGRLRARPLAVRGVVALVVAVAANVALVLLANAAGIDPEFRALTVPPVAFLTVVGVVGATLVYGLLARRVADPDRTFHRVAVAVLAVSLVPDLALPFVDPAASVAGAAVLILMHVVAAAVCVGVLVRGRPRLS
jgi:hypothetical protein